MKHPVHVLATAAASLLPCAAMAAGEATAAPASLVPRAAAAVGSTVLVASAQQPEAYRYTAFPTLLRVSDDEVWVAYKAGRSHATDVGAAIEVVRHSLARGTTELIQRIAAPAPKLYQMGELVRFPDGTIALYLDVQAVGWDGRHYRSGAETLRWDANRRAFGPPAPLPAVDGVTYGYPFDFVSEGDATWQLVMAFGYLRGGRWSVDAIRSDDAGRHWTFVRNLTEEFGGIQANESGFVRCEDGFIVTTRGYDRIERLHRTDGAFRVRKQVELTGRYPFLNSYVGRPRLFLRDGQGYLIGRNWTCAAKGERGVGDGPMQLCLFRFDPASLEITSCVILDNADNRNVTDGYYAVTTFSGSGSETRLHVVTYKALDQRPPDIVRLDYRWDDVK